MKLVWRIALPAAFLASLVLMLPGAANDTRMATAAMGGDHGAVRSLIEQKVDVNVAQGDGMTALHWAAFQDDLEMTRMLLAAGAGVKAATRDGAITPLLLACTGGNAAIIQAILDAGADVNSANANGTTALMSASSAGNPDAVKLLLDRGADIKAKEHAHGQTALMFAAALNRSAVVKLLLQRGAEANAVSDTKPVARVRFDQDGNIVDTPAGRGAPGAAAAAAAGGAGGGRRGGRGGGRGGAVDGQAPAAAPLTNAAADAADAAADAADAAAKAKSAQDAAKDDLDALSHGLGFKTATYAFAKLPVVAGDVAARAPRRVGPEFTGGMTALLYAAREGHLEAVRALLEGGADINLMSADKFTPLVEAITNGHLDVARYLVDHNANPNLPTLAGLEALYAVIDVQWAPHAWFPQPDVEQEKTGYLDLMKALLDHGADVNAAVNEKLWFRSFTNDYTWVDPAGATAFWRAAQSSDTAAMKLLVEHGADTNIATKSGETPLMAAAGIGWAANWSVNAPIPLVDAVKYCVELGNDVNAADNRGYTALHGAGYLGNNDMVTYLVSKGAKVDARSKAGDFPADMANGPTRFGQPHPETLALLEKLGSPNSHNCRSDLCVVQPRASIYERPLTVAEQTDKDNLDKLATAMGFQSSVYLVDVPGGGRGGRGGQR
jgi:uncharacterized protein